MTSMNPILRTKLLRHWQNYYYFLPEAEDESASTNQRQPDNPPETSA